MDMNLDKDVEGGTDSHFVDSHNSLEDMYQKYAKFSVEVAEKDISITLLQRWAIPIIHPRIFI